MTSSTPTSATYIPSGRSPKVYDRPVRTKERPHLLINRAKRRQRRANRAA